MDKCTGCGVCQEKCPSKKIPSEFNRGLGNRTAIYTPFAQAIPNVPVIDRENCIKFKTGKCGVCSKVCQAGAIDYDQQDEIITQKYGADVYKRQVSRQPLTLQMQVMRWILWRRHRVSEEECRSLIKLSRLWTVLHVFLLLRWWMQHPMKRSPFIHIVK